jgi:CRISPR/Cas system-associated endoribonuclease Cas2
MGWGPYDVNTHMNHLKLEWHEGINKTREAYFEALRLTPTQVEKLKREITTYQTSREREVDAFLVARKTH